MLAYRFDFFLPREYNDGSPVEDEKFLLTQQELVERYGTLSWMGEAGRPPIRGIWEQAGVVYIDHNDG